MSSNLEVVAVSSQKHDPAWKHCEMYKNEDNRIQLKCIYCGKIFKGGGIHRIKEHLAGQKGNASTCLRVDPHVRLLMQDSLNGVVIKKRRKQKLITTTTSACCEVALVDDNNNNNIKIRSRKKKRKPATYSNNNVMVVHANSHVHMAIARFFLDARIPFDAVNSVYFQPMIDVIASQGAHVAAPGYHDFRSWVLKASVEEVRYDVDECSSTWTGTGCSVLVDEWVTDKGRTLVNFFVYCPRGTMFLRSVDASCVIDSPDSLFELLKEVVEEVGVRNVLHVVTRCEERYVVAGKRLTDVYPTLFWTPCAAHSIDLMLEDIKKLEWIYAIMEQAKFISRFIYNNNVLLSMLRKFTYGVDLVDMGFTCSVTDFLTLKRMVNIRHNLQSMVTSVEWMESPYSKKPEGLAVLDYINNPSFWSTCSLITRLTDPILRLLRIVSSEERPAMAYVYAGLYRAKETIKKELVNKKDYLVYWNIIDNRWEQLQRHPLHAAGFYLNPKFFYTTEEDVHLHIRSLVYDCIEKLIPDPKIQDKIVKETASYHNSAGDFGRKMAVRARDSLLPGEYHSTEWRPILRSEETFVVNGHKQDGLLLRALSSCKYHANKFPLLGLDLRRVPSRRAEWWSTYGGGCPNLARLAIRILSQTSSLIRSRPGQILLEKMHETKNCIERQRLNDLAFVQYNLWLRQSNRMNIEPDCMDSISYDKMEFVHDWVSRRELSLEDMESADWMMVDPPSGSIAPLGPLIDDIEALGAGFDDYEIFVGPKESEEENGEEDTANE